MSNNNYIVHMHVALSGLNIGLHTICSTLLCHIYRTSDGSKTQQLYLLNLSMMELLENIFFFVWNLTYAVGVVSYGSVMWLLYLSILLVNISAMFLITADRLVASWLILRYNYICTVFRVKVAILCTWVFCLIVVPSVFGALYFAYGLSVLDEAELYAHRIIFPVTYFSFFVFASSAYTIMFVIFVKSRRRISSMHQPVLYLIRSSKFYIALLLILSFLLLSVLPQLIKSGMVLHIIEYNHTLKWVLNIAFFFSDTADGIIYFIFYSPIRKLLGKFLRLSEADV